MQCKKQKDYGKNQWRYTYRKQRNGCEQQEDGDVINSSKCIWGGGNATSAAQTVKYDAYISSKTKEIKGFKLPKANDFEYINIKGTTYRVRHNKTYNRHIVDLIRTSDNYILRRDVFTSGGSYGMATTRTRAQVVSSLRNELLNLLKHG